MAVARQLQPEWERNGTLILRRWRGTWQQWDTGLWSELAEEDMVARLYMRLEHARYVHIDGRSGAKSERPWAPAKGPIANLTEAVGAITKLSNDIEPGTWLDGRHDGKTFIPCQNGLVNMATRELIPPTPGYFNTSRVPFDYDRHAPTPVCWLAFLESLWPDDPEAIAALQEMFGYVLSGRRHLQKIFFLVGPTRSGKGTISKILTALVGAEHCASPTMAGLATNFGLQALIGKTLATIEDARMPRDADGIVERLLMISGQDRINVGRKHREDWIGQLSAQMVMLSNELPKLTDASAAIAGRFIILRMTLSFLGKEDQYLLENLMPELPAIFNWSLDGLDRLTKRGRFLPPESSAEAVDLIRGRSSPITQFLMDCCELEPDSTVTVDEMWIAWRRWCSTEGRDHTGTKSTLETDLFAAEPRIRQFRPRSGDGPRVRMYRGVRLTPGAY
jgi:putative DNA primase/helicase